MVSSQEQYRRTVHSSDRLSSLDCWMSVWRLGGSPMGNGRGIVVQADRRPLASRHPRVPTSLPVSANGTRPELRHDPTDRTDAIADNLAVGPLKRYSINSWVARATCSVSESWLANGMRGQALQTSIFADERSTTSHVLSRRRLKFEVPDPGPSSHGTVLLAA